MNPEDIQAALARLGDTTTEVAETLSAGCWRGDRDSAFTCPVAAYLTDVFGAAVVSVGLHGPNVFGARVETLDGELAEAPLPDAVLIFVDEFDAGGYPDLECDEWEVTA